MNVRGQIKWFDPGRGFGFVADDCGGNDILLHVNVLRNFGQGSVADGSRVEAVVVSTPRGRQVAEVRRIDPPAAAGPAPIADLGMLDALQLDRLPLLAARVKWFDKAKGFGFANVFARRGDVFLHIEVLRHCGFAELTPGEAVTLRMIEGPRGMVAAQILPWERAVQPDAPAGYAPPNAIADEPCRRARAAADEAVPAVSSAVGA
ncbi:MAG TPA: cold shock domain-containing protein [Paracoccus sp. (in: a-proteobacteria)]|nr:cold shock domain-containing protein [Paracoccus sp. (in: a-proteobacteria)]